MKPTYRARSDPMGEEDVRSFRVVEGFGRVRSLGMEE